MMLMMPVQTDKLDAAATVAVNGHADDRLLVERIARRHVIRPTRLFELDAGRLASSVPRGVRRRRGAGRPA